jgi:hypothetical protein
MSHESMVNISPHFTVYGSGNDDYHCRLLTEGSSRMRAIQNLTRITDRQFITNRDDKRQTAVRNVCKGVSFSHQHVPDCFQSKATSQRARLPSELT